MPSFQEPKGGISREGLVDQVILYSKEHQSGRIFCAKALHEPIFYSFYSPGAYIDLLGYFLCCELHTDISYHFTFTFIQGDLCIEAGYNLGPCMGFLQQDPVDK